MKFIKTFESFGSSDEVEEYMRMGKFPYVFDEVTITEDTVRNQFDTIEINYGSLAVGVENIIHYLNDVVELNTNGGTIYRIVWLSDIDALDTAKLGHHWTYEWNLATIEGNLGFMRKEKAYTLKAHTPPHNVTIGDLWANTEELEFYVKEPSLLKLLSIK